MDLPGHSRKIAFIHMFFRGKQTMSQLSVVCDKKQSFRVFVQPSDREQILFLLQSNQIHDGLFFFIFGCGDHTCRFVQHQIAMLFIIYWFSV